MRLLPTPASSLIVGDVFKLPTPQGGVSWLWREVISVERVQLDPSVRSIADGGEGVVLVRHADADNGDQRYASFNVFSVDHLVTIRLGADG